MARQRPRARVLAAEGWYYTGDLLADSIQLVNLMLRLEEVGITIPIEAAWEVETVGDAYVVYTQHVAS